MTCQCGGDCGPGTPGYETKRADRETERWERLRIEALKIALQTLPGDRTRDPQDLVGRAEIIHRFLTNTTPAEGSRQAS